MKVWFTGKQSHDELTCESSIVDLIKDGLHNFLLLICPIIGFKINTLYTKFVFEHSQMAILTFDDLTYKNKVLALRISKWQFYFIRAIFNDTLYCTLLLSDKSFWRLIIFIISLKVQIASCCFSPSLLITDIVEAKSHNYLLVLSSYCLWWDNWH